VSSRVERGICCCLDIEKQILRFAQETPRRKACPEPAEGLLGMTSPWLGALT
jgi:hypothetical protein